MTFAANGPLAAAVTKPLLATAVDHARPLVVHGLLWRAASTVGDLLTGVAIVLCIPVAILAVGIPIALVLRLLLRLGGML